MQSIFLSWLARREGVTAIEYALLAGGIAGACLAAILLTGDSFQLVLETVGNALTDTMDGNPGE